MWQEGAVGCLHKQIMTFKNIFWQVQENSMFMREQSVTYCIEFQGLLALFHIDLYISFDTVGNIKVNLSPAPHIDVCLNVAPGPTTWTIVGLKHEPPQHKDVQKLASNDLHMKYKWPLGGVGTSMYTRKQKYEHVVAMLLYNLLIVMGPRGPFCAGLRCLTKVCVVW